MGSSAHAKWSRAWMPITTAANTFQRDPTFSSQLHARTGKMQMQTFDQFDEAAIKVIVQAQEVSKSTKQNYLGALMLLVGITYATRTKAVEALEKCGVNPGELREAAMKALGTGTDEVVEPRFTPEAREIFNLALKEAEQLKCKGVSPSLLLLAIIKLGANDAVKVLEQMKVDMAKLTATLKELEGGAAVGVGARGGA